MTNIQVVVNDDLTLDAGAYQPIQNEHGKWIEITPPAITLFEQVVRYLEGKPAPPNKSLRGPRLGIGLGALCIRWGSYLATLMDDHVPLHPDIPDGKRKLQPRMISFLNQSEMKRLNIEISANIAQLGIIFRDDHGHYYDLVQAAAAYLPMPFKSAVHDQKLTRDIREAYVAGACRLYLFRHPAEIPDLIDKGLLSGKVEPGTLIREMVPEKQAERALANILVNRLWRNTAIESYHEGMHGSAPLLPHQRRFSFTDEHILLKELCSNMISFEGSLKLLFESRPAEQPPQAMAEFDPGYPDSATALVNNAHYLNFMLNPYDWTRTEASATVQLYQGPVHAVVNELCASQNP